MREMNDCDGSGPHREGDVRVLPLTGGANLILCRSCYAREIDWRNERNAQLAVENRYPLPRWDTLEKYRDL